jgi:SNF2 family DNA or RNA helicase
MESGLFLWGEASRNGDEDSKPAPKGRRPKNHIGSPYPYDAGQGELVWILKDLSVVLTRVVADRRTANVWLPTIGAGPIPSSPMIAEIPTGKSLFELRPWSVGGFLLGAEDAVGFLTSCMGRRIVANGVLIGDDLAYWAEALRFAGAMAARQQYLPDIKPGGEEYASFWKPVFGDDEQLELSRLAERMPPAARALAEPEAAEPPQTASKDLLEKIVGDLLDCLVRSAFRNGTTPGKRKRRVRSIVGFDSVHDAWLAALKSRDPIVAGEPRELAGLAAQVREWRRPLMVSASSPFRLCFRLEEPEIESDMPGTMLDENPGGDKPRPYGSSGNSENTGGRKPRPYGSSGNSENTGGGKPRPYGSSGNSASSVGEGFTPSRSFLKESRAETWTVRYLLQPRTDRSLLTPLETVWGKEDKALKALKRHGNDAKEYALTSLGQAAGICPRIAGSLDTACPYGYPLDAQGAYEFLTEKTIALEQAGFGVMLPAWWAGKGARLKPKARVSVKSPGMTGNAKLSLGTVIEFDWQVALGGETMTLEELKALAALKSPLVRFRGQWVEMKAEDVQSALEAWKKKSSDQTTVRDAIQMYLGAKEPVAGLELDDLKAHGRVGELLRQLEGLSSYKEEPIPAEFGGSLRPYQVRGFSWLSFLRQYGLGACLADDMGLGKTIQTLALIQKDREEGEKRPVLLICPTSVVNNWYKEAGRFTPKMSVFVHHGASRLKGSEFKKAAKDSHLVVSTYGLLQREAKALQAVEWAGLVLDEAQNIKNPETKQAKAARAVPADYRIALTGTPVENHVGDLWSIMEFLNSGFLGSKAEFRRKYFLPIQTGQDPDAADRLKRITGPFILRRVKTDKSIISDLPDKIETKTYCHLTPEQASLYASVVKEVERSLTASEGIQRKGLILATLSKLKQVCNHPAHFLGDNSAIKDRSGKIARLTETLNEIMELNESALVFTQFVEMGDILKKYLQEAYGREALFLHGGTPKGKRDRMVDRFQNDADAPPIFILSLKAGGTGLNLTRANHVFHFDRWWNPAVENQATDRVFRIGQKKNVQVHKMICLGTLEEKIDDMIEGKKEVAEKVVGAGEGWLTELSNKELKDLLTLRREAVEE